MKYVPNVDITLRAYTLDFILYGELVGFWPCLVPPPKVNSIFHRMFRHMYGVLNID